MHALDAIVYYHVSTSDAALAMQNSAHAVLVSVHMHVQVVAASYTQCLCAGLTTGLVVDSGASQTTVTPVLEGYCDVAHMRRLAVAGDHVTRRLRQLTQAQCSSYSGAAANDALYERMKERCCYAAVNMQRETAVRNQFRGVHCKAHVAVTRYCGD